MPNDEVSSALVMGKAFKGGELIGFYERLFFFATLVSDHPAGIAVWLTFKVAAKWAGWQHIMRIPEDFGGKSLGILHALRSRNLAGTVIVTRFLVGTLYNVLAAAAGMGVLILVKRLLAEACGIASIGI